VSARLEGTAERVRTAASAAIVLAGIAILVARPFVGGSASGRIGLFGAAYVALGLASLAVPVPAERHAERLEPAAALVIGLAAVAMAAAVAGTPVPSPWSPATLPLGVLAAVAEEALFRRAAYGRLVRFGAPAAVIVSATLFALVHLPAYGVTAFPVDLGAGLLLSWQRWVCGRWSVPAVTHVAANLVAAIR
jgi:membrane protease YdiL (CAAX protease family)